MDPITAICNACGALFSLLATPQGQNILGDVRAEVADVIRLFHSKSGASALTPAAAVPPVAGK